MLNHNLTVMISLLLVASNIISSLVSEWEQNMLQDLQTSSKAQLRQRIIPSD
jgi:hypothetical protein